MSFSNKSSMSVCPVFSCRALNRAAAVVIACAGAAVVAQAGEIDPPVGPVAPTFKTLHEVEPRTPIKNDFDTFQPIVISGSGSYYLTEEILAFAGQHGIQISADNVTLDLNGFTIRGNLELGSLDGIRIDATRSNIVIRNGFVRDFTADGIDGSDATGIIVEDIVASNNGLTAGNGIAVGNDSIAMNCIARNNGGIGVLVGFSGLMKDCVAIDNTGDGLFIASGVAMGCTSTSNDGDGIQTNRGVIAHVMASGNNFHGISSGTGTTVFGCATHSNGMVGIRLVNAIGSNCTSTANTGVEIEIGGSSVSVNNHSQP